MDLPTDRVYTESHEWHRLDGETVTVGLTTFAVEQLTDVTYVEMQPAGSSIEAGGVVGEVESVKATSDVYCAAAGEVVEVNEALASDPSLVNNDPYEGGWLVRVKVSDSSALDGLLSAEAYASKYAG